MAAQSKKRVCEVGCQIGRDGGGVGDLGRFWLGTGGRWQAGTPASNR